MKLWLDDAREPPDETWTWVRTVEAATALMRTGEVTEASLDNDLGSDDNGQRLDEGRVLCRWMAETNRWPSQEITIHSGNVSATAIMKEVIRQHGPYVLGWHAANFVKPEHDAGHDPSMNR